MHVNMHQKIGTRTFLRMFFTIAPEWKRRKCYKTGTAIRSHISILNRYGHVRTPATLDIRHEWNIHSMWQWEKNTKEYTEYYFIDIKFPRQQNLTVITEVRKEGIWRQGHCNWNGVRGSHGSHVLISVVVSLGRFIKQQTHEFCTLLYLWHVDSCWGFTNDYGHVESGKLGLKDFVQGSRVDIDVLIKNCAFLSLPSYRLKLGYFVDDGPHGWPPAFGTVAVMR